MLRALPIRCLAAISLFALAASPTLAATPSTSTGRVSVAQVMDFLDRAGSDGQAALVLTAYLAGVGESAGILLSATNAEGKLYVTCERPVAIDDKFVRGVLKKAAPDKAGWTEMPATQLIISALVNRAGCR